MSTALYRFYDCRERLLYVGITKNPPQRFRAHGSTKDWWKTVTDIRIEWHPSRAHALRAEEKAIKNESPTHNIVHNGRPCDVVQAVSNDDPMLAEFEYLWRVAVEEIGEDDLRPANWRSSVDAFLHKGLTLDHLEEAIAITMLRPNLEGRWRYFCGVAWNKIRFPSEPRRLDPGCVVASLGDGALHWNGRPQYQFTPRRTRRHRNALVKIPGDVVT